MGDDAGADGVEVDVSEGGEKVRGIEGRRSRSGFAKAGRSD